MEQVAAGNDRQEFSRRELAIRQLGFGIAAFAIIRGRPRLYRQRKP
jgi:hypothetical protein